MKVEGFSPTYYPLRPAWKVVLLILLALLLAGCGRQSATEPAAMTTFVSQIAGTESFIGLVTDGRAVVAYVCDGQSVSHWFRGGVTGGTLNLESAGGARLQATVAETVVQGQFTLPGAAALAFSADPAIEPAGLYRAEHEADDGRYIAGWVVLADGRQRGLVNMITDGTAGISDGTSNTIAGSIPLTFAGSGGGPHIEASSIISPSHFLVSPVRP
jgi:hypothetical protein